MSNSSKNLQLRVDHSELDVITEIAESRPDLFEVEQLNEKVYILTFKTLDTALDFDDMVKEILVYKGFDINYNPTEFGLICERLIDKLYEILE